MPTSASQPRQIRLFLSSTFRDMENERHELLTRVFPLFRQQCLERQVVFSEIDLRWGITEEDAHNGQTVQICLEEIARCRAGHFAVLYWLYRRTLRLGTTASRAGKLLAPGGAG
jgi:hypothetical protein